MHKYNFSRPTDLKNWFRFTAFRWLAVIGLLVIITYVIYQASHRSRVMHSLNPNIAQAPVYAVIADPNKPPIILYVADTETERTWGLSDFTELLNGTGMLFIFDTAGSYPFWMKDMLIPLDMVWLDDDYTVIDLHTDIAPDTYPTTFVSITPARYVIELPAGSAADHSVHVGQVLQPYQIRP